jgi:hypothetical protein
MMNSAPYATVLKNAADIDTGKADLTSDWFTGIAKQYKQMADAGCFLQTQLVTPILLHLQILQQARQLFIQLEHLE